MEIISQSGDLNPKLQTHSIDCGDRWLRHSSFKSPCTLLDERCLVTEELKKGGCGRKEREIEKKHENQVPGVFCSSAGPTGFSDTMHTATSFVLNLHANQDKHSKVSFSQ